MRDYWYMIEGCLAKYRDAATAVRWLERARKETSPEEYEALLEEIAAKLPTLGLAEVGGPVLAIAHEYKARLVREQEARRMAALRTAEERRRREEELEKKRQQARAGLADSFRRDYLQTEVARHTTGAFRDISTEDYRSVRKEFVQSWAAGLELPLDADQATAAGETFLDTLVTARAGSGKTRTLLARTLLLIQKCGVAPDEVLLLAFNKKAAEELKSRLARHLPGAPPHVMTFHALAYALVHPEEELIFDDRNVDQLGLSRDLQDIIDQHIRTAPSSEEVRALLLDYFRDDWEQIIAGGFQLSMTEFLEHRRSLPRESLRGDYVKSFGERLIANTLFEHGVPYHYERNFRWDGFNYRPDFTIPFGPSRNGGVVIEYFGLSGDPDYDELAEKKRAFWRRKSEWMFLELSPPDIARQGPETFAANLLGKLKTAGIDSRRLSDEEIWEMVKRRALDSFTTAIRTFVSRGRKFNLSAAALAERVHNHTPASDVEARFLPVAYSIYSEYLEHLRVHTKEDFDGLVWRAVAAIRSGQRRFVRDRGRERGDIARLRYVMIDEYQDFSRMFHELLEAMRSANKSIRCFCVGDDWQAINAFAGSDIRYFTKFGDHFRTSADYYLRSNYRSCPEVVNIGNALMRGLGPSAIADTSTQGWVRTARLDDFRPTQTEQARHAGDEMTAALLRILRFLLQRSRRIVLLSRRNGLPWYANYKDSAGKTGADQLGRFLEHVRSYFPEDDRGRILVSTAHQYKGLEEDAVVVLDAVKRSYPLVHPTWSFCRVFGDCLKDIVLQEQNLFYVAATRARVPSFLNRLPGREPISVGAAFSIFRMGTAAARAVSRFI